MTAVATSAPRAATSPAGRIGRAFRLHFVNPTVTVWMPLGILAIIFAMNWVIWLIVVGAGGQEGMTDGTSWNGATSFVFVYLLVTAVQAMSLTFQYALGLGETRRDYYLGTVLAVAALAAGWAILVGALAAIEEATNGWGLGGHMFASVYFGTDGPLPRVWYVFLLMLLFGALGLCAGALFVRWRRLGITAFFLALAAVAIAALAIIGLTNGWGAVGAFFGGLGFAGTYPLLLVPTAIAGALGFLALRGATPRG